MTNISMTNHPPSNGTARVADRPQRVASALTDETRKSRRITDETRKESLPGKGSRKDGMSDRLSRTSHTATVPDQHCPMTHRDRVNQLTRCYCELGTATFDCVDGRLLSHEYQARRTVLCAEIRRLLLGLDHTKGTTAR